MFTATHVVGDRQRAGLPYNLKEPAAHCVSVHSNDNIALLSLEKPSQTTVKFMVERRFDCPNLLLTIVDHCSNQARRVDYY